MNIPSLPKHHISPLPAIHPIPVISGSRMRLIYEEAGEEHSLWHLNKMPDGNWTFVLPKDTYPDLFEMQCPEILRLTPKTWKLSAKKKTLWFPKSNIGEAEEKIINEWASHYERFVLLGLNANIKEYFTNELDFCLAASLNAKMVGSEWQRTPLGEAEYRMKYHVDPVYFSPLIEALAETYKYLPLGGRDVVLCVIPSENNPQKLPRRLARELSEVYKTPFMDAVLNCDKPQFKNTRFQDKIPVWNKIFGEEGNVMIQSSVKARHVVIIDDLYMSGATMWSFAKYLKAQSALSVFGLVCVKAMNDDDNIRDDEKQ